MRRVYVSLLIAWREERVALFKVREAWLGEKMSCYLGLNSARLVVSVCRDFLGEVRKGKRGMCTFDFFVHFLAC